MKRALALLLGLMFAADAHAARVAVMYFKYTGSDEALAPLGVAIAEMVIRDLNDGSGRYTVVERNELQAVLSELDLGHSAYADQASAVKVGHLLSADYLVLGSYEMTPAGLRVDARIVDSETGVLIGQYGAFDKPKRFATLEADLSAALKASLDAKAATEPVGTSTPSRSERATAPEATPRGIARPDPQAVDAAVAFGEGLIHLDEKDLPRAREAFERAVTADPSLEDARAALEGLEL
jgi:TolB-like protein